MKLTSKIATDLAMLRAKRDELIDQEKNLCEKIKAQMQKEDLEEFSPTDSPYKLVLNEFQKRPTNWAHKALEKVLRRFYGKKWKVELTELEESADRVDQVTLLCQPNPHYKKGAA